MINIFKTALSIFLVLVISTTAIAAPYAAQQYVPGDVLVKFKSTTSSQVKANTVSALGNSVHANLYKGLSHLKLSAGQSVESAVAAYNANPNVEYAQPNYIYHIAAMPNDTNYGQQWAFKNTGQTITPIAPASSVPYPTNNPGTIGDDMNMALAWDHVTDCSSVVVAVIDTGVNYNHQDLAANMWNGGSTYPNHGYNFTSEGATNDPMDLNGHGTHVTGIIGAVGNNALGSTGVCWKANIMAVRVMDATGHGTTANIISGINFAVTNGAKVINMSLSGGSAFDQLYSDAITNAQSSDVVVVTAASNDGLDNDVTGNANYPCNFTNPNLICVAALDQSYALATFSNWGSTSVDVGAPGTNVLSAWSGSSTKISDPLDGTGIYTSWQVSSSPAGNVFAFGNATPNVSPYIGTVKSINYPGVANWPTGYAPANTNSMLWTTINLAGLSAATLDTFGATQVVSDGGLGYFAMAYNAAGGNPFAGTPSYFPGSPTAVPTAVFSANTTFSLANCLTSTCTVGFQIKTGSTTTNLGASLVGFTINALVINNTTYKLVDGTSMATPAVAGLATMLRAYNPKYTYTDVVSAIKNGGNAVSSLSGKTTTGKAVNAMKSLAYINQPTGLSATIQ